jgi:hypothetical protein
LPHKESKTKRSMLRAKQFPLIQLISRPRKTPQPIDINTHSTIFS